MTIFYAFTTALPWILHVQPISPFSLLI